MFHGSGTNSFLVTITSFHTIVLEIGIREYFEAVYERTHTFTVL